MSTTSGQELSSDGRALPAAGQLLQRRPRLSRVPGGQVSADAGGQLRAQHPAKRLGRARVEAKPGRPSP